MVPESAIVPLAPWVSFPMCPYSRSRGADHVLRLSGGVVAESHFAVWSAMVYLLCLSAVSAATGSRRQSAAARLVASRSSSGFRARDVRGLVHTRPRRKHHGVGGGVINTRLTRDTHDGRGVEAATHFKGARPRRAQAIAHADTKQQPELFLRLAERDDPLRTRTTSGPASGAPSPRHCAHHQSGGRSRRNTVQRSHFTELSRPPRAARRRPRGEAVNPTGTSLRR